MESLKFEVPTISCGHCVNSIQSALIEIDGVSEVWASAESKSVEIEFEQPATSEIIRGKLIEINYPAK